MCKKQKVFDTWHTYRTFVPAEARYLATTHRKDSRARAPSQKPNRFGSGLRGRASILVSSLSSRKTKTTPAPAPVRCAT